MNRNTLILYDTVNDHTNRIAHLLAEQLRGLGQVEVLPIFEVSIEMLAADVDLLVVGGQSSTQLLSWEVACEHGLDPVFCDFLRRLPDGHGAAAAVYDVEMSPKDRNDGATATYIAHQLVERGYRLVVAPECFRAKTSDWTAELEDRAIEWADELASAVTLSPGQYPRTEAGVESALS